MEDLRTLVPIGWLLASVSLTALTTRTKTLADATMGRGNDGGAD
jgi:hypothetical protein